MNCPTGYGDTSADFSSINYTKTENSEITWATTITPERVFKVIFVGDSSVGKSSLIRRICRNAFNGNPLATSTTIGVDFQTRTLMVDDISVCIQCWDTAGQERYR